jgi:hypothetical protein
VADGKRVKCPKCGNLFTTPGLVEDDEEERPHRAKAANKKEKAAIKKGAEPEAAAKKHADDDDESGGIYSYVPEKEVEKEDKPDIEYAPDMSIKDLRGPAQEAVVKPSNYVILLGGINCLCDLLLICISFWPMVFMDHIFDHETFLEKHYKKLGTKEAADKIKSIPKERKDVKKEDLAALEEAEDERRIQLFISLGVFIFLFFYHAVTIVGAVRVQNLESRGWGIASSIMTMIPLGSGGLSSLIGGVFYFTIGSWILDEMAMPYAIGLGVVAYLITLLVGVWLLRTLLSQVVIDGFEYVAE